MGGHNSRLRTYTELQRRSPIPKVNRKRRAKRKAGGEVYGPYYVKIANLRTCVGQRGEVPHRCVYFDDRRPEAHHLKKVGSGGRDASNCIDVCHGMHDRFESLPLSQVEEELGLDMRAEAARLWEVHGP